MLRLCLALLAAATAAQLGRSAPAAPPEPQPAGAQCLEHVCFGVFWGRRPFPDAGRVCAAGGGHLLTVRSTVAADAMDLLVSPPEHCSSGGGCRLWLGLQLPRSRQCSEPGHRLRGFRWVTGEDESPANPPWRQGGAGPAVCGRPCVAVAAGDLSWEETPCDSEADGFLCEYNYSATCAKLSPKDGLRVTYTTPFGAKDSDLLALPPQSTASAPGLELVCQQHSSGDMRWGRASPGAWHCELENGGCEGTCRRDGGTPLCTCPDGEQLNQEDKRSCSFPNPCTTATCEHLCVPQAPLNFSCMCHEGYELAEDRVSCRDIDDCKVKPGLCDQACSNTEGGFQCQCYPGYELVEGKCEDVIDCYEDKCQHQCEDVPGGYNCSCFNGYARDPRDRHKCVLFCNQSECPADCDPHTQDTCFCPNGFILDQGNGSIPMCVDIDECDMGYCDQLCTNEPGHYRCHCQEGYNLSHQHTCVSEDEFSGETESYPKTAVPTRVPPKADSLHPGVLVGISVGILSTILALMALLYHLMKKHCATQGAKGYKCNNSTEKDMVLQQVTPGCPSANQKL
ncbi:thrombomodulin [Emydura macquarii macquarii]|uniref:thrombomodulin n=1 Tax=Emydura macquarii macquarii TaxID=1129001 RepID=UPI00352B4859